MAGRGRVDVAGALTLVTGAGSGIGRSTALALAGRGASVLAVDIDELAAERTAADCRTAGAAIAGARRVDVGDRAAMEALAAEVHGTHGPLDVLVNNAGVGITGRFTDTSLDDWTWIRRTNLDGVIHGCALFGPPMLERGRGHVVNVSSTLGYVPTVTEPAYVTTKAGVLALSQCLRADWRRDGVGVSAICPGVVDTPIITEGTRFRGDQASSKKRRRTERVFRRGHRPEQVAAAIVDAVEHDRAVVPVGWEARAGWLLHRLGPLPLQQLVARGTRR
jgi:NAD(P)-dependent dehydrogenase (short-subunit alcohol dehydrogenase family)